MTDEWQNRIVGYADVDPNSLLENPLNAKYHPIYQQNAVGAALDEYGWVKRIGVSKRTNLILDGHGRVALAVKRGEATVPVRYVDLDEAEETAILATFDAISGLAGKNVSRVQELMQRVTLRREELRQTVADMREGTVEKPAPAKKKAQRGQKAEVVKLRLGPFVQEVSLPEYERWHSALVEQTGEGAAAIVAEVKRRLGFES